MAGTCLLGLLGSGVFAADATLMPPPDLPQPQRSTAQRSTGARLFQTRAFMTKSRLLVTICAGHTPHARLQPPLLRLLHCKLCLRCLSAARASCRLLTPLTHPLTHPATIFRGQLTVTLPLVLGTIFLVTSMLGLLLSSLSAAES